LNDVKQDFKMLNLAVPPEQVRTLMIMVQVRTMMIMVCYLSRLYEHMLVLSVDRPWAQAGLQDAQPGCAARAG
jgi:hypothetical protein